MSPLHPAPGVSVGDRYELTSRIAGGGMGEVWAARDRVLGREVAVKLLRGEHAGDATFLARFRTEARHAASLSHPGIASVYDYGEDDGAAFLVMELVPGEPLSARLRRDGALAPALAVPLLQQAATALAVAHATGLVHRDVKPANLMITPDQQVKVTDFGIARLGDDEPITATGEVMGTAQYLSPEQALGQPATPASDIYSLGVVAYEALAGRRPFEADSAVAVAMAHVQREPGPLPATVPVALAAVVAQAMAKDPAQRPASAAAFGQALGSALAASPGQDVTQVLAPVPAAPGSSAPVDRTAVLRPVAVGAAGLSTGRTPPRQRGRGALVLALLAVLAAAAVAVALLSQSGDPNPSGSTSPPTTSAPSTPAPTTPESTTSSSSSSSSTPSQTPTQTPTQTPGITLDPQQYVGQDGKDVLKELKALGLDPTLEPVPTDQVEKNKVVGLSSLGPFAPGDPVTVQVAAPGGQGGKND